MRPYYLGEIMFKSFAELKQAHVKFRCEHPVASATITVTGTLAALMVLNAAAKLSQHPQIVNIYYTKSES